MPQGDGLVHAITAAALAEQRDELAPSQVSFADYNQPDLLLWPMSESGHSRRLGVGQESACPQTSDMSGSTRSAETGLMHHGKETRTPPELLRH
jgi:hypothetical protein